MCVGWCVERSEQNIVDCGRWFYTDYNVKNSVSLCVFIRCIWSIQHAQCHPFLKVQHIVDFIFDSDILFFFYFARAQSDQVKCYLYTWSMLHMQFENQSTEISVIFSKCFMSNAKWRKEIGKASNNNIVQLCTANGLRNAVALQKRKFQPAITFRIKFRKSIDLCHFHWD